MNNVLCQIQSDSLIQQIAPRQRYRRKQVSTAKNAINEGEKMGEQNEAIKIEAVRKGRC